MSIPLPQSLVPVLRTSCFVATAALSLGCGSSAEPSADSVVLTLNLECPESAVCPPQEGRKLVIRKFLEYTELHPALEVAADGLDQMRKSKKPQIDVVLPPGRIGNVTLIPELYVQNGNSCWGNYFDYVSANVVAGDHITLRQSIRPNGDAAWMQKCINGLH